MFYTGYTTPKCVVTTRVGLYPVHSYFKITYTYGKTDTRSMYYLC